MSTLFRAFCTSTCILTAVYYVILFRYYNSLKRTLWFPVLCVSFTLIIQHGLVFAPFSETMATDETMSVGIMFLSGLNFSAFCMNMYNATTAELRRNRLIIFFNIILGINIILCLVLSPTYFPVFSIFCSICVLISDTFGLFCAIKLVKSGMSVYIYSVIASILMILSFIPSVIWIIAYDKILNSRILIIPLYIFLHLIMLTSQYKYSIFRTKKMADSLSKTIDRISHSSNALQCTQLKPDFLFNTLDMISERCDSDSFTAEELTISLSKYLRHTLNFQQLKGIVPLSNELELSKAFTSIEKERFPKLEFVYKLPEEIPQVYVPPLSIQPLIENAIEHAFSGNDREGKITIKITPYKDYCHIDVSDNGKGIPEDELSELPDSLPQTARIGLYNIHRRLTEKFEKGLVIQSATGVGTSVSFVVPPEGKYTEEDLLNV